MAFRQMRRARQALPESESRAVLQAGNTAVLALTGDNGYPYALPLNYVCEGNAVYFHSAKSGHKLDAIARCNKASLCVIARDDVLPEKFTTLYKSVIAFGRICVVEEEEETRRAARLLAEKYCPLASAEAIKAETEKYLSALAVLRFDIEHLTGKQGAEFLQNR